MAPYEAQRKRCLMFLERISIPIIWLVMESITNQKPKVKNRKQESKLQQRTIFLKIWRASPQAMALHWRVSNHDGTSRKNYPADSGG